MNRPHLRPSDYDNSGDVLPDGYKRLKDGTIVETDKISSEDFIKAFGNGVKDNQEITLNGEAKNV